MRKQLMRLFGMLAMTIVFLSGGTLQGYPQENQMTDLQIQDAVEDEIAVDPAVALLNVAADAEDGIVTLSGRVNNILAKERAEMIAETVKGVRGVINEIRVSLAEPVQDEQIRKDIIEAIDLNPATNSANLIISVSDGVATVSGTVRSYQEKLFVLRLAKGIRGVVGVVDNTELEIGQEVEPETIKASVQSVLRWDTLVDDALIAVDVEGTTVSLRGIVGSQAEKSRATLDAWVAGVNAVDASELDVAEWARNERLRGAKHEAKSDQEIRTAVEQVLRYEPNIDALRVATSVVDGVVTLRGNVSTIQAKRAAERAAENTVGVVEVVNRIRVSEDPEMTDAVITNNIRGAVMRDPYLHGDEVTPVVVNGLAYLYGDVDDYFEKAHADDIVGEVPGVMGIVNNLRVRNNYPPYRFDPYVDDFDITTRKWYEFQPTYTIKSDFAIERDIRNHLWWSPYVNSDDIVVTVENGVATLSGMVPTINERNEAREQAYDGGASWVVNNLDVAAQ